MTEPVQIVITTLPKLTWKLAAAPALQLFLIGVGILAESSALQWSGFIGVFVIAFCYTLMTGVKNRFSIPEARKRLDEIEAETTK